MASSHPQERANAAILSVLNGSTNNAQLGALTSLLATGQTPKVATAGYGGAGVIGPYPNSGIRAQGPSAVGVGPVGSWFKSLFTGG
jgi:hypothetical protein